MAVGDNAGLALLSSPSSWIGLVKTADGLTLQMADAVGSRGNRGGGAGAEGPTGNITKGPDNPPAHLWFRVHCNFDTDQAIFSWSANGKDFQTLGSPVTMRFQLQTFQGVRPSLFNFSTTPQPGGYADFDNYTVEEPRARGIEREIPIGKTVVLTSGADGSFLVADTKKNILVNLAPESGSDPPQNAKFQVIDVGLGRVALKASSGKILSADNADSVVLKDLGNDKPGDAESFQWVNLMHGDTMLMSLTNHRYLTTKPNSAGPVTVMAPGPNAARKSGAEFKWKAVD
jgi:hypothetical protein